jgi:hypothetical protein
MNSTPFMEINGDAYDAKLAASCITLEDTSRDHLNNITFASDFNGDAYDAKLAASCIMPEDYSRDHLNYETFGSDAFDVDAW